MRNRIVARTLVVAVFLTGTILIPVAQANSVSKSNHTVLKYKPVVYATPNMPTQLDIEHQLFDYNMSQYWKWIETASASIDAANAAAAQQAEIANTTIPSDWMPTAICEEGGHNDSNYGYFGIKEWNGFDGYSKAGYAPLSVQLDWEAKYIGGPPDAPGQCHDY